MLRPFATKTSTDVFDDTTIEAQPPRSHQLPRRSQVSTYALEGADRLKSVFLIEADGASIGHVDLQIVRFHAIVLQDFLGGVLAAPLHLEATERVDALRREADVTDDRNARAHRSDGVHARQRIARGSPDAWSRVRRADADQACILVRASDEASTSAGGCAVTALLRF